MNLNCHAIITGASKGIGRKIAQTYVQHGAQVLVCARGESELQSLADECQGLSGQVHHLSADVTDSKDRARLVNEALGKFDTIDVLVNNAGILGSRETIAEYPDDLWDEVIDVNLNAMFHLTRLVLQSMLRENTGRIINITSGVGVRGSARWGAYAVSKFGVEGFTQVLADELKGTHVEVNAVNPGPVSTAMRAAAYPKEDPDTIPSPEDIMDIFLYLASDESRGNNGRRYEAGEFHL